MSRTRVLGLAVLFAAFAVGVMFLPPRQPASAAGWATITAGSDHTCSTTVDGTAACWGENNDWQLGTSTADLCDFLTDCSRTPLNVSGLGSSVAVVEAGRQHTCALMNSGAVKCWGANSYGQLGDGQACGPSRCVSPVAVSGLTGGVTAITAGGAHTCALMASGGVKCWGSNNHGQLGDGQACGGGICSTPVDVAGIAGDATAIAAGGVHTCALLSSGGVKCWGANWNGQIGDGTKGGDLIRPEPVDVLGSGVTAVATGGNHTCAIMSAGGAKCWGANWAGQIGDGTSGSGTNRTTPVDVLGLGSTIVVDLAAGENHTCVLMPSGGAKCWGDNGFGQLGIGNEDPDPHPAPEDVLGLGGSASALAAGANHTCALMTTPNIKCWGQNAFAQLGDGTTAQQPAPVNTADFAESSVFPGPGIPDEEPSGVSDTIEILAALGSPATIKDLNVGLKVTHTWVGDLVVTLTHVQTGTTAVLVDRPGRVADGPGCSGDGIDAVLDDEAVSAVEDKCDSGVPTISGSFVPNEPLSVFDGESLAGSWTINVSDHAAADEGDLDQWTLIPSVKGASAPTATATDIPTPTATSTGIPPATPTPTNTVLLPHPPTPTPTPTPTVQPGTLIGDANCDGTVNAIDAALILQYAAGLVSSLPCQASADIDGDGDINAIDAALILQYTAGLIPSLPP